MKLALSALIKFALGLAAVGAMLFLPAQTFRYPGAWLLICLLFVPIFAMGIVLLIKSPALLEKRLGGREEKKTQRGVVMLSGAIFPLGFILSALDFRFGWSRVPLPAVVVSSVSFLIGYALYAEVMCENAYLSRTVRVQENQTVVTTGLYAVVRHPMYLATLLMFLPMPMILGSFWGLIPFALYPAVIVVRLMDEERLLARELAGYGEYQKKVKYRLIPFVW